jgi:hypothetical protein
MKKDYLQFPIIAVIPYPKMTPKGADRRIKLIQTGLCIVGAKVSTHRGVKMT